MMVRKFRLILFPLLFLLIITSCQEKNKLQVDVSKLSSKVDVIRFDKDYYGHTPAEFSKIKQKYPYMFPSRTPDSVWIAKMQDSMLVDLQQEVNRIYPNLDKQKNEIEKLFKHVKYYYKHFKEPKILTLYSDWNYLQRAVYLDTIELVTLDNFLGADNKIYKGIPEYIRQNLVPERMVVEIAKSIVDTKVAPTRSKTLLSKMVNEGKKMYLLDAFLPSVADRLKIGYSKQKMDWAKQNEAYVWTYFIENKLLYSSENKLDMRFMNLAPYSKFYTEQDANSPGRIGVYFGWQIVRSFMKKNEVSLQELIRMDEEELFKKSGFKPKK